MLVLTRKQEEIVDLYVGDEVISIMVVRSNGGVRLGFTASDAVKILRREVGNGRSEKPDQE